MEFRHFQRSIFLNLTLLWQLARRVEANSSKTGCSEGNGTAPEHDSAPVAFSAKPVSERDAQSQLAISGIGDGAVPHAEVGGGDVVAESHAAPRPWVGTR